MALPRLTTRYRLRQSDRAANCLIHVLKGVSGFADVSLTDLQLTPVAIRELIQTLFRRPTQTQTLDLRSNAIDNSGVAHLAELLVTSAGLRSLDLQRNQIQCQGAIALAAALQLHSFGSLVERPGPDSCCDSTLWRHLPASMAKAAPVQPCSHSSRELTLTLPSPLTSTQTLTPPRPLSLPRSLPRPQRCSSPYPRQLRPARAEPALQRGGRRGGGRAGQGTGLQRCATQPQPGWQPHRPRGRRAASRGVAARRRAESALLGASQLASPASPASPGRARLALGGALHSGAASVPLRAG